MAEGAFAEVSPDLQASSCAESGWTWLPSFLWRTNKIWRGLRAEVPWVKQPPATIVRDHVRFTLQPTDAPPDPAMLARTMEQVGSDEILLFSTDYPHWQFDGADVIPDGLPAATIAKLMSENALKTYPRLSPPPPAQEFAA